MSAVAVEPKFIRQPPNTPMTEVALRVLVEFPSGETHVIGTATVVSGYLAVTAGHVIDDIIHRFGATKGEHGFEVFNYSVRLYQTIPGPRYIVWNVAAAWRSEESDLALLHLALHRLSHPEKPVEWRCPRIVCTSPALGTEVAAFGYHSSTVKTRLNPDNSHHLGLLDVPQASTGEVEEILPRGQPAGRFTFPCYRVAARFDAGMSGGPVYDGQGQLCGIISGTYGNTEERPISYVAMLWPMLRLQISANRSGRYPKNVTYPAIDLALDDLMYVVDIASLDPAQFPGRRLLSISR
jgi:hypothetical protein